MNPIVKYQGPFSRIVGFGGKCFLFSPAPSTFFFFCSRSNFRAITRLETLAMQVREEEDILVIFVIKSSFCPLYSLYNPTYVFALSIKATERITDCTGVKHFAVLASTNLSRIRSVSRALDCRVGGHGFDCQGRTIT